MRIEERIGRIITLGMFDKITGVQPCERNIGDYVAAGNPGVVSHKYPQPIEIPDSFMLGGRVCHKGDYLLRTVFGNSMFVDGIPSGWELLLKPVYGQTINRGDFVVINVDKDYFKHRHGESTPLFQLKLRRAIGKLMPNDTGASLCNSLRGTFAEPLDQNDQEDLNESLSDARSFYASNEPLYLSVTYHKSNIHYSFHPVDSIIYRVEGVAYKSENGLVFKTTEEL